MSIKIDARKGKNKKNEYSGQYNTSQNNTFSPTTHQGYGTEGDVASPGKGTLLEFTRDMDQIFPLPNGGEQEETEKDKATEKVSMPGLRGRIRRVKAPAKKTLMDSFGLDLNSNAFPSEGDEDREGEGGVDPAPPGPGECIFPQERPGEPSLDPEEVIQDKTLHPGCDPIELDPPGSQRENTGEEYFDFEFMFTFDICLWYHWAHGAQL